MQDHNICKLIYSNIGVKRSVGTSNLWLTLSNALKTWLKSSNMHFFLILRFPLYFFKISFVYLMSFEQSGYILPGLSVFVFPLSTTTETTFQGYFFGFPIFWNFAIKTLTDMPHLLSQAQGFSCQFFMLSSLNSAQWWRVFNHAVSEP